MLIKPFSMATAAAALVGVPKLIATTAIGASAPDIVQAATGADWMWLKDAGTVGVLMWMVVWFQNGSQKKDDRIYELTTNVVKSIDKMADAIASLSAALAKLEKDK